MDCTRVSRRSSGRDIAARMMRDADGGSIGKANTGDAAIVGAVEFRDGRLTLLRANVGFKQFGIFVGSERK